MFSFEQWLIFFWVTFVVSASPGPLMLLAMTNGISYGYTRSLFGVLGGSIGHILLVVLVAAGFGALAYLSDELFNILKWLGVFYLLYLGLTQLFSSTLESNGNEVAELEGVASRTSNVEIFTKSLIVSISNPKAWVYFAALLPQFVVPGQALVLQLTLLTLTFIVTDFIWMSAYALGGRLLAGWLNTAGRQHWVNRISGLVLLLAALILALAANN